ncbi:MAG: branched-chain amino acid ABC transporter permease [Nitratireductor sp.]
MADPTSRPAPAEAAGGVRAGRVDRTHVWLFAAMAALVVAAPYFIYPVFVMKVLCFALFACAYNLLLGYGGLLSFGHALFFGSAAYVSAHAAKEWGLSAELCVLVGTAYAVVLGVVVGWLAIRRHGIYFAMITLALAQMMYFVYLQAPFTHGEDGIQGVPRNALFGAVPIADNLTFYYFGLAIFLAGFLLIYRIIHSPFGQVVKTIRENEQRAISLGYRVEHYKLMTFTLSATLAGVAGATKALVFGIASLTDVFWAMSGEVVLMTLIGGLGTVFGPVIGAAFVVALQNYLADYGSLVTIIQGAIFIICVLVFRRGLVGQLSRLLRKSL